MGNEIPEEIKQRDIYLEGLANNYLPADVKHETTLSPYGVKMRFFKKGQRLGFGMMDTDGLYGFLLTLHKVEPLLKDHGIAYDIKALDEIHSVWDMGGSSYCYSYSREETGAQVLAKEKKSYHDYFAGYDLPDEIKAVILDGVRASITNIKTGVYTDCEGCAYNSVEWTQPPAKRETAA